MAFEAALAVAKSAVEPDMAYSSYNPLFIYGPSGLGKRIFSMRFVIM
ncbi:MAG: DnaA ATPase domain-containing protein [Dialister sp.]